MDVKALTVGELTLAIKGQLEGDYAEVWVEGEVTNYRGPAASGHRYFSLKDPQAQLKAVIFRGSAQKGLAFELEEGQQVLAHGRISVYEPRGEYQLVADRITAQGLGALQAAFEQLKKKLEAEGLFSPTRKKPLPEFPSRIAVITSPTGAVLQDILQVTARRCPWIDILLMPVRVQGQGAKDEIASALRYASAHLAGRVDLVLVARGGGSLEDLWAFNEEVVARAIADCPLPVLSAIGHETDFTIADFVADSRAPTPSAAAEMLSASAEGLRARLGQLAARSSQALWNALDVRKAAMQSLDARLQLCHPRARLEAQAQRLDELASRFSGAMKRLLAAKRERLAGRAGRLNALSPLAILSRGFAACFDASGKLVRAASQLRPGQPVEVRLGQGSLGAVVSEIRS